MAACREAPRLFPGKRPDLDRYWAGAAAYMNDCVNTTVTTANPHFTLPFGTYFGKVPPANTLAFMLPGFRRVHCSHKSEPKAERYFYLNRGWNHPRDCVKVVTLSGHSSETLDVTWEVDHVRIIADRSRAAQTLASDTYHRWCYRCGVCHRCRRGRRGYWHRLL